MRFLATLWLAIIVSDASCYFAHSEGDAGSSHSPRIAASGGVKAHGPSDSSARAIEFETRDAEVAIAACSDALQEGISCIAAALDKYANALRALSPNLPGKLQRLHEVVERAARNVRLAKTSAEAVVTYGTAIAEVHKTISLLKADDPILFSAETRATDFVAETFDVATAKLDKAVGL
jgi:hypothetical protein